MTVAEFIERLSKQNKEYVICYDYGRGLEEISWNDFFFFFLIWNKSAIEQDDLNDNVLSVRCELCVL